MGKEGVVIVHEPSRDCYEHSLLIMMQSVGACVTQLKRQRCKRQRLLLGHSHGHALKHSCSPLVIRQAVAPLTYSYHHLLTPSDLVETQARRLSAHLLNISGAHCNNQPTLPLAASHTVTRSCSHAYDGAVSTLSTTSITASHVITASRAHRRASAATLAQRRDSRPQTLIFSLLYGQELGATRRSRHHSLLYSRCTLRSDSGASPHHVHTLTTSQGQPNLLYCCRITASHPHALTPAHAARLPQLGITSSHTHALTRPARHTMP